MKETNLFGNDFVSTAEVNSKYTVTNFEYIPASDDDDDDEDWVVGRVVMSFGDIATLPMYLYGGRFFWVEFNADERDMTEESHSRMFVRELIRKGKYSTAVDYLINLHIHLAYKHLVIPNKLKSKDGVLQEMLMSVFGNESVYVKAKEAYIKYINDELVPVKNNFSLSDLDVESDLIDSSICTKELAVIRLNIFNLDDAKIWGDMYKLNDVESVSIYTDDSKNLLSLSIVCKNKEFRSRAIKVEDLKDCIDEYGSYIILCLLLEIFSSKEFNSSVYNVQGLLYDKRILTIEQIKSVQLYSNIIKASNNGRFTENFCAIKLIADATKELLFKH